LLLRLRFLRRPGLRVAQSVKVAKIRVIVLVLERSELLPLLAALARSALLRGALRVLQLSLGLIFLLVLLLPLLLRRRVLVVFLRGLRREVIAILIGQQRAAHQGGGADSLFALVRAHVDLL
jgi:hypothetical protein